MNLRLSDWRIHCYSAHILHSNITLLDSRYDVQTMHTMQGNFWVKSLSNFGLHGTTILDYEMVDVRIWPACRIPESWIKPSLYPRHTFYILATHESTRCQNSESSITHHYFSSRETFPSRTTFRNQISALNLRIRSYSAHTFVKYE